jgi:DNA-binding CsgD family transcriptional regulator
MAQSDQLSRREWDVAKLVLEGKSNKAIALALHISESTVEFHLKNIYAKHQVSSRVELLLKLRESTVAGESEHPENRTRLNFRGWAISFKEAVSKTVRELKVNSDLNTNARGAGTQMTFFEAILVCFTKYADFNGRATRAEFWWFALFITLADSALIYLSETIGAVFLIAVLLPLLAAGTRRLRDSGKSGWWQLFLLVPAAGVVLVGFLWALPSTSPLPEDGPPA